MSVQLDGELSELDSARLSAHVRGCAACAAYALELAGIAAHLRAAPLEQPAIALPASGRRRVTARSVAAAVACAAGASLALGHALGAGPRPAAERAATREPIPASVVRGLRADAVPVPTVIPAGGRRMGQTVVL